MLSIWKVTEKLKHQDQKQNNSDFSKLIYRSMPITEDFTHLSTSTRTLVAAYYITYVHYLIY